MWVSTAETWVSLIVNQNSELFGAHSQLLDHWYKIEQTSGTHFYFGDIGPNEVVFEAPDNGPGFGKVLTIYQLICLFFLVTLTSHFLHKHYIL